MCQTFASFKANSLDWELDAAKALTQVSDTENVFEPNAGHMFQGGFGEMTAEDVRFSFERYITPAADGSLPAGAGDFLALDHVEVTRTYSGRILLKNPSPTLWIVGICDSGGAILSDKATEALDADIATKIIGSGAYTLPDWQPGQQITLEQDPAFAGANKGVFQKIVIKPVTEPRTALLSLLAGELSISEIASQDEARLADAVGIVGVKTSRIDYTWIGMNVEKPTFSTFVSDRQFSRAIKFDLDLHLSEGIDQRSYSANRAGQSDGNRGHGHLGWHGTGSLLRSGCGHAGGKGCRTWRSR